MATVAEVRQKVLDTMSTVLDADPATMNYKIGSKTVNKTAYLQYLGDLLAKLDAAPPDPECTFMAFDFDISEFGENIGEFV